MNSDRPPELERLAIRELIENWVLWRDTANWERFATVWHDDGQMVATWFQASAQDFISRSRMAWERGVKVLHVLGGSSIEIKGSRAIAETKMEIIQRAVVHDVEVDVHCHGLFVDSYEHREGRWGLVLRQPLYDMDSMVPVNPADTLVLEPELLAAYPEGYRHLAYLQSKIGLDVKKDLPGTRGPATDALRESQRRWLASLD